MENKLGQKLSHISALISKQKPNQIEPQNMEDEMRQYKMIFPNVNQGNQGQPSNSDFDRLQQVEQIIQEQKKFQNDISLLLNRLGQIQESNKPQNQISQSFNKSTPNEFSSPPSNLDRKNQSVITYPSSPQKPMQLFVQNSPINDQNYRNLKEQNIDLLRQVAQLTSQLQTVDELKLALQQSNDRIRDQQYQMDNQIKENLQLKQQLIQLQQENIQNKRMFDDTIENYKLTHQREIQSIKFQAQESLNSLESNIQQQFLISKAEKDAIIQSQNQKIITLQQENKDQQDYINKLHQQLKEIQNNMENKINDLNNYHQSLEEKKFEFDQLQQNYNTSLEKYDTNTKNMIVTYNQQLKQLESVINQQNQQNNELQKQLKNMENIHYEMISKQKQSLENQLNGKIDNVQKESTIQKQQIQQIYEDKMKNLSKEKESLIAQKQQSIILLEQKIAVLVQDNKYLTEELERIKYKAQNLEQVMFNQEEAYQNLTKDSQYKTLSLTKQIQELNSLIGNNNSIKQLTPNEQQERIKQLEQQLQYKKEEMDLLLHHLDQVFEINRDFENKIKTLSAQLELMEEKNNREQEQTKQLIKNQKNQIQQQKQQIDKNQLLINQKESQYQELQQKLQDKSQLNDQQTQDLIKQLKLKNVELVNENDKLHQNYQNMKSNYDRILKEQIEQQEQFEKQKKSIEDQFKTLQQNNSPFRTIKKEKNNLDKDILEKDETIKILNQKIIQYQNQIQELESKIIQKQLSSKSNDIVNLDQYNQNKIKELELRIVSYNDQVQSFLTQQKLHLERIKTLENALMAAENEVQQLTSLKNQGKESINKQSNIINFNKDESKFLEKDNQLKAQQEQIQQLLDQNKILTIAMDKLTQDRSQIVLQYEQTIKTMNETNINLSEQIAKLKKEKAQINLQLMQSGMANLVTSQISTFSEKNT